MKIDDSIEYDADVESGNLRIRTYALDRAGNPAFVSFNTDIDSGFASMTLEQADRFAEWFSSLVRELKAAQAHA